MRSRWVAPRPEHPHAHRPQELVRRPREEIASQGLHVQGQVRRRLRRVDQDRNLPGASDRADVGSGVDQAEHVRDVAERHESRPRRQRVADSLRPQTTIVIDVDGPDHGARALRQCTPRQQVGVVLGDGEHDLVAGAEVRRAPGRRRRG